VARISTWLETTDFTLGFAGLQQTGNVAIATLPAGWTLRRTLLWTSFWIRQWGTDSFEYTRNRTQTGIPAVFGLYWMGSPGATTGLLPYQDKDSFPHWIWWERITWRWAWPINQGTGFELTGPNDPAGFRDISDQRGGAGSAAADIRYCWEVDEGALHRPPIWGATSSRILALQP